MASAHQVAQEGAGAEPDSSIQMRLLGLTGPMLETLGSQKNVAEQTNQLPSEFSSAGPEDVCGIQVPTVPLSWLHLLLDSPLEPASTVR